MGKRPRFPNLILVMLLAAPCVAQSPAPKAIPGKPDYSKEAAVLESLRTAVRFENDGTGTRDMTARVRVISDAGVQQYSVMVFGYSSSNEALKIDYVRVREPDGSVVETPASSIQDVTSQITLQAPEYTDYREKHVAVKGLGAGDELEYHVHIDDRAPLIPGQFWFAYDSTKTGIILDEELEVNVPAGRALKMKSSGIQPTVTEQGGRRIYLWKSSNPKTQEAAIHPAGQLPPPDVELSTFQTWEEVGRWWAGLEKPRMAPTADIRAKAAELTRGLTTDDQKLRALYGYVATKLHYISISFGIGRFEPHAAGEEHKNEYGDCKDQETLLSSLLDAVGIKAWPALINSTRELDPDVPSPGQFDHVITVVPQGHHLLWMDTTTQVAPPGFLIFVLRNKQALVIPDGLDPLLAGTPPDSSREDLSTVTVNGKLGDDGTLTAKIASTSVGDKGLILRLAFRSVAESHWKDLVLAVAYSEGYGGTASDIVASSPEDADRPFHYSFDYTRKEFPDWKNPQILVALPFSGLPELSDDPEKASQPILLGVPVEAHFDSKVELPKGYAPTLPGPVNLSKPYAEYHAKYSFKDGALEADRDIIVKVREVPATQREDYGPFRKAVSDDEGRYVLLSNGGESAQQAMANPEFRKAIEEAKASLQRGDLRASADAARRATAAEPNYEQAWQMVAEVDLTLRMTEEGIAALRKAIGLAPTDIQSYRMLATALFQARREEEGTQVWRDFVHTNPEDASGHSMLGFVLMNQGKFGEAIAEYERAVKIDPKDWGSELGLGESYAGAGETEKAAAAFESSASLNPTPHVWNDIGYAMAVKRIKLPEAEHFTKMAVEAAESDAAKVSLENLQDTDLQPTVDLTYDWDSLGWVYFREGNLQKARDYVAASWELGDQPVVAEHLGEIEEELGRNRDAIRDYASADVLTFAPRTRKINAVPIPWDNASSMPAAKDPLARLIGHGARYDAVLNKARDELSSARSYHLSKAGLKAGSAEFFVVITAGGKAEGAKFISGSDALRSATKAIASIKYNQLFPEDAPTKIVRRGILACSDLIHTRQFVLLQPEWVRSVR